MFKSDEQPQQYNAALAELKQDLDRLLMAEKKQIRLTTAQYEQGITALPEGWQKSIQVCVDKFEKRRPQGLTYRRLCTLFFEAAQANHLLVIVPN